MHRLLVVDDDSRILSMLQRNLRDRGFEIEVATNGVQAKQRMAAAEFDAVLCDIVMPSVDGLDVYEVSQRQPNPPAFVYMTGYPETARKMPVDPDAPVLFKPFEAKAVADVLRTEIRLREQRPVRKLGFGKWLSVDAAQLRNAAQTSETILILGETGVGKTRLVRQIHEVSRVRNGPFIIESGSELSPELAISALFGHRKGAFTGASELHEGAVGAARGGTLFLDEIGELKWEVQGALLRFLSDRSYSALGDPRAQQADVRVIAATNRDLAAEVKAGRFREDLYHRLRVVELTVQPLRERPGDIERLVQILCVRIAKEQGRTPIAFSPSAMAALSRYAWPGNIRQLENLIRSLRALRGPGVVIEPEDIGPPIVPAAVDADPRGRLAPVRTVLGADFELVFEPRADLPDLAPWVNDLQTYLEVLEYRTLLLALRAQRASKAAVARKLGYGRTTLTDRVKRFSERFGAFAPLASPSEPASRV